MLDPNRRRVITALVLRQRQTLRAVRIETSRSP